MISLLIASLVHSEWKETKKAATEIGHNRLYIPVFCRLIEIDHTGIIRFN